MMIDQHAIDITEIAVLGEQFPLHLMQLGFRLMQVIDSTGQDTFRYVLPPICTVPAGSFLMGSNKDEDEQADDEELPQHIVALEAYGICTYPLTVIEYVCAVQAGGVGDISGRFELPLNEQLKHLDYPIVCISWNDARNYCQWLSKQTGTQWRLPTEAEWEKAARGTEGLLYPWGNQWDTTRDDINRPGYTERKATSVGSYSNEASPYGVQDMFGNVYEWTSSSYKSYPYQANDGREGMEPMWGKVVRGGPWGKRSQDSRAAYRTIHQPCHFAIRLGVRLVHVRDGFQQ